jgi:hypothetical protein
MPEIYWSAQNNYFCKDTNTITHAAYIL